MTTLLYPLPKRTTVRANGPKTSTHSGCYYNGRLKRIRLIVIHAMQSGEGATTAEAVGAWFQNPDAKGSTHVGVDTDSICRYVDDDDTAWGAPGANADGLHLEHAGKSEQTASQWRDDASLRIMENGAIKAAEWCIAHGIPARWLSLAEVKDGVTCGLTWHKRVSDAFGGTHWDPGTGFPFDYYLDRVKLHIARIKGTVVPAPSPTKSPQLKITGVLDKATILRMQQLHGTTRDGVISRPSQMVAAHQRLLQARNRTDWDGKEPAADGLGIQSNAGGRYPSSGKTRTIWAWQKDHGLKPDGFLSGGYSNTVAAQQKRMNAGKL